MKFKVIVRVRPLSQREKQTGSENVVTIEGKNNIAVTNIKVHEQNAGDSRERIRRFAFDYCFAEDATQENIFETVEQIVGASLKNGHHSCVLAYGQSSSGKTHTMMGFPHNPGLTPRLCRRIFKYFENENLNKENNNTAPMKVTVSYLEIYNEKVADLLNNDNENNNIKQLNGSLPRKSLRVREHPKKGPYVEGLSQHLVSTDQELLERLETGTNKRRVGSTITNPRSSRSHSVFSISCDGIKLHLVDLAGNERTGSRGEYHAHSRFREGANINKSLVALGNVISNLADHSKGSSSSSSSTLRNKFVPYRDSILTWLLKDTLQGNSNTVMIATVSPSSSCYSETVNTLRFGQRAKLIVYKPVIVEDSKEKTIRELKFEIARLKELLSLNNNQHYHHQMNIMSASCENDCHKEELKNASDGNNPQESTISESCSSTVSSQENLATINSEEIMSKKLSRNFSIDTTATTDNSIKSFSSQDSLIQSPKRNATSSASSTNRRLSSSGSSSGVSSAYPKPTILSLKREAISKNSAPLLKSITQKKLLSNSGNNNNNNNNRKSEKGIVTEITGRINNNKSYQEVKNSSGKPRAQIVAAVTSRLYSKVNKKDIGISTEDLVTFNKNNAEPPKELSICSNARNRLREITKKALKAHKSKDVETQTMDLSPVMRVKEVATDCSDLDNIEEINNKEFKDAEVNCTILNDFIDAGEFLKNIFVITKSCGVQTASFAEAEKTISFRKYLINPPIYTESVNINVSHNYNNNNNSPSSVETLSDDSLDNNNPSSVNNNVGFSTPDLISNHNSLENETEKKLDIQYALCNQFEENWENVDFISNCKIITNNNNNHAKIFNVPLLKNFKEIDVICTQATEILQAFPEEKYKILPKFNAIFAKASATIVRNTSMKNNKENVQIFQPICFQQISTNNNNNSSIIIISDDDEDSSSLTDLPSYSDSLEYHKINQNKKVKFINNNNNNKKERKENQRMMKAMKEFLEEAQILMGNLKNTTTTTILRTECNQPHLDDFDIEVTLNEISGIEKLKNNNNNYSNNGTQTELLSAPSRASSSSQTSFIELPSSSSNYGLPLINKYDTLLEDSCRRLEEQIKKRHHHHHHHHRSRRVSLTSEDFDEYDDRSKYYNPWDLSVEDSSLESNPITFSDYGSLPRKTYKRQRTPTCSPSAFLRQLTQMRKQIIENSQEELLLMQGSNSSN